MLKNVDWSIDRDYKTGSENEPLQFYLDGLANSSEFYLLLGYFSSAAINLLSVGFATFISKGGKLKMVINHLLSQNDKEAIEKGQNENFTNKVFDITDIVSLNKVLDEYDTHFFECLAYLISEKRIEIKIIKPKGSNGIAHYKSGVFSDGENYVGYKASCNFTLYGLSENLEELEAFLSWENGRSNKLIKKQLRNIDDYFTEVDKSVEYLSSNEIEIAIRDKFSHKDINELIVQEEELLRKKARVINNKKVKNRISKICSEIDKIIKSPRFPYKEGAREYQVQAYQNWVANNYQGILAMATGTGKTITALNIVLEQYKLTNSYKAIILVPTIGLAEQWDGECRKFNYRNVIKINSSTDWQANLALLNTAKYFTETSYIIIATYASFYRPRFQEFFKKLDSNTILIGDEVHNMGSQKISTLYSEIHLEKRIGLSATPKRIYDEDGGAALEYFFNDKAPYVFSYTMEEAIENEVLCPYLYYPHIIELTDKEFEEYVSISKQLAKFFDEETKQYKKEGLVEILLLKRKRIIHKAENKKYEFEKIVKDEFQKRGNLKYTLVYVPEGIEPDYCTIDESKEDDEDISLIDQFTKIVSKTDNSIMVKQYTANAQNREKIIKDYSEGKVHVLTSMKCLDEGIDVPRSELAIFCASTGNPRQFIQRRGRILRKHKDKVYAVIHDLVVIPKKTGDENTYSMERGLVSKEIERVVNFSQLADNKTHTYQVFEHVLEDYDINLNDFES